MKKLGYLLVALQFSGIFLGLVSTRYGTASGNTAALLISVGGVALGLYTLVFNRIGNFNVSPLLRPEAVLITTGPYRFIRHPMYLSVILFLLGLAIYSMNGPAIAGFLIATLAMLGKMHLEEQYLAERFPGYLDYKAQTKKLFPFIY